MENTYHLTKYYRDLKEELHGDIRIDKYDTKNDSIDVYVPYDKNPFEISLEGINYEDRIDYIKSEINMRLEDMIDYLGDCKL